LLSFIKSKFVVSNTFSPRTGTNLQNGSYSSIPKPPIGKKERETFQNKKKFKRSPVPVPQLTLSDI